MITGIVGKQISILDELEIYFNKSHTYFILLY